MVLIDVTVPRGFFESLVHSADLHLVQCSEERPAARLWKSNQSRGEGFLACRVTGPVQDRHLAQCPPGPNPLAEKEMFDQGP